MYLWSAVNLQSCSWWMMELGPWICRDVDMGCGCGCERGCSCSLLAWGLFSCPVLSHLSRVQRSRSSRHFLGADRAFYYSFAPRQFSLMLLVRLIPVALD